MAKRKAAETPSTVVSFEESLTELQMIVADLEEGSLGLESSLARFERGVGLLRACYVILDSADQKIEILAQGDATGSSPSEPASPVGVTCENIAKQGEVAQNGVEPHAEIAVEAAGDVDANGKSTEGVPSLF